jgi:hypothetical protein
LAAVLAWVAVGTALPALCTEADKAQASPRRTILSRLSFEVTGGWARAALDDLNLYPTRDEEMVDFTYRKAFEAVKAQKGAYYSYDRVERSGKFTRLHSLYPAGCRLSLDIGYGWTAYIGLSYLTGRVTASYREVYDVSDLDPNKMELDNRYRLEIEYPPYPLSVRAWSPTVGIRLKIPLVRRMAWEGYVAAGWLAASFRWDQTYATTTTDEKGRWSRSSYGYAAAGRGSGPSLEGGGRLGYSVSGRLTAFLEAGYAYRKTGRVDGEFAFWTGHEDSDSAPYGARSEYEDGVFWTRFQTYTRAYGVWTPREVRFADSQGQRDSRHFRLDLSGVELRVGLAVRL